MVEQAGYEGAPLLIRELAVVEGEGVESGRGSQGPSEPGTVVPGELK